MSTSARHSPRITGPIPLPARWRRHADDALTRDESRATGTRARPAISGRRRRNHSATSAPAHIEMALEPGMDHGNPESRRRRHIGLHACGHGRVRPSRAARLPRALRAPRFAQSPATRAAHARARETTPAHTIAAGAGNRSVPSTLAFGTSRSNARHDDGRAPPAHRASGRRLAVAGSPRGDTALQVGQQIGSVQPRYPPVTFAPITWRPHGRGAPHP